MTVYLNNAATSYPKPNPVSRAVNQCLDSVPYHPGRAGFDRDETNLLGQCRTALAALLGISDPETLWLLFALIGVGTFLIRLSFIYLFGRFTIPAIVLRLLRFVPPAALSALIFPAILLQNGAVAITPTNERFVAALVAAMISVLTQNMLLTICSGLSTLWILQVIV